MSFVPPSGGPAEELPPLSAFGAEWAELVIPDDAAELDLEAQEVRAELAASGATDELRVWLRRRRLAKFPRTYISHKPDRGTSIFFGACVVLVGLVLAALPMISGPAHNALHPAPSTLATTSIAVGAPGGLMPDIQVSVRGRQIGLRDLRPSVFVLLPPTGAPCGCDDVLRNVVTSSTSYGVPVYFLDAAPTSGKTTTPPQAEHLTGLATAGAGYAVAVTEKTGSLAQLFRSTAPGVLAVFVASDGRIVGPALPLVPKSRVESWLDRLA